MKICKLCGVETPGALSPSTGAYRWPICQPCKIEEDAAADRMLRSLATAFKGIDKLHADAQRRLPVRLAPKLDRQEMRRLAKLTDSELAIEATARRMLPVLMVESDGRDLDARDGEEADAGERYERISNLQDRYTQ